MHDYLIRKESNALVTLGRATASIHQKLTYVAPPFTLPQKCSPVSYPLREFDQPFDDQYQDFAP